MNQASESNHFMETKRAYTRRIGLAVFALILSAGACEAANVSEALRRLESEAASCRTAAGAARVYTVALTSAGLEGSDRNAAEARRTHWLELADEGRRRIGREWLDKSGREKLEAEADLYIEQSFEMVRLGNGALAEEHLKEASRRFLESGRADMILGLIYATVLGDTRRAAIHFAEVIKREPGNAYAYNNLALTALAERKYSVAIRNFRKAFAMMPDSQELSDNLAMMLGMIGSGQLVMPKDEVEAVSDLYRLAIHDLGLQPYQPTQGNQNGGMQGTSFSGGAAGGGSSMAAGSSGYGSGGGLATSGEFGGEPGGGGGEYGSGGYGAGGGVAGGGQGDGAGTAVIGYTFFTPFGRPVRGGISLDPATIERLLDDPDEMVTHVWSGTGVAVAEGYVLTTLDVVGDATKVMVRKPDSLGLYLEADVVASSDETGLVLLDCMDLEAPAIPIDATGIGGGGKVLVGGYPGGLAERLTGTVSGAKEVGAAGEGSHVDLVVAFPKRENADACGSGGIVVGPSGGLVGLVEGAVSSGTQGDVAESAAGGYGVGASVAVIRAFLEDELDESITEVSTKPTGWSDVAKIASDSAVFIYAKKVRPGKPQPQMPQGFAGVGGPGGFGMAAGPGYGSGEPGYGSGFGSSMPEEPGSGYGSQPPGASGGLLSPQTFSMQSPGSSPQPGSSSGGGYGSQPPGSSPQGYGSQPPGSSPQGYGSQPPGSSPQGYGSQPPGSSPQGYGSQPPGSSPQGYGSGMPSEEDPTAGENAEMQGGGYGSQPPGGSPQGYGSQPPGSSPQGYGSQPPGSSPQGYGSQPPGSSPQGYGSQPPGSSPQGYGSQPPGSSPQGYGSSPQGYGSGMSSEEDPTAGETAEMEGEPQEPSGSDGASVSPGDYPLAQQTVLNGTLSLLLPGGFEPMSQQMLQTKYPGANRPTLVYSNSSGSINIAINHTQNAVQPNQLKELHQALDQATRGQVPDGNWRFSGFQTYAGREWVQLEFLSDAADTKIENVMVATSVDGRMLVVSFNVTQELAGEWLSVGKEIIKSIKAND